MKQSVQGAQRNVVPDSNIQKMGSKGLIKHTPQSYKELYVYTNISVLSRASFGYDSSIINLHMYNCDD